MIRQWSAEAVLNAGTAVPLKAGVTGQTIFVTKVTLSITGHAAGKLVAVQDSAQSPKIIAKHLDAAAAAGVLPVLTWDFGKRGISCGAGKDCNAISESGGPTGIVYAEGYIF